MGLDQYAWAREREEKENSEGHDPQFTWRKHAKLQEFMERTFSEKTNAPATELNCGELELTLQDIERLEKCIEQKAMPISPGGFFYGHQFQDESEDEYRDQDIMFCEWAKREIAEGKKILYSCWW
tara:strand:+ start:808 stop:1182 length:375 start_codon:yes stop_codon:yes gene_type:complete